MTVLLVCSAIAAGAALAAQGPQENWAANQQHSRPLALATMLLPQPQSGHKPEQPVELHYKGTELDGVVTSEHCTGKVMRMTVKNAKGPVALHSADYTKVGYNSDLPNKGSDIDPCTELKGRTVKVWFTELRKKAYHGEIEHIEIVK